MTLEHLKIITNDLHLEHKQPNRKKHSDFIFQGSNNDRHSIDEARPIYCG